MCFCQDIIFLILAGKFACENKKFKKIYILAITHKIKIFLMFLGLTETGLSNELWSFGIRRLLGNIQFLEY